MAPTHSDWTRAKIRFELSERGYSSYESLARRHGKPGQTVSNAIRIPHRRGEEMIATALGVAPAAIWPSRYDRAGNRLSPQPRENYRRESDGRDSQKRTAA